MSIKTRLHDRSLLCPAARAGVAWRAGLEPAPTTPVPARRRLPQRTRTWKTLSARYIDESPSGPWRAPGSPPNTNRANAAFAGRTPVPTRRARQEGNAYPSDAAHWHGDCRRRGNWHLQRVESQQRQSHPRASAVQGASRAVRCGSDQRGVSQTAHCLPGFCVARYGRPEASRRGEDQGGCRAGREGKSGDSRHRRQRAADGRHGERHCVVDPRTEPGTLDMRPASAMETDGHA